MWTLLNMLLVGHTILDLWAGDEVLQLVFVSFVEGFELVVDIDDEVLSDKAEDIFLLRVYLACITIVR